MKKIIFLFTVLLLTACQQEFKPLIAYDDIAASIAVANSQQQLQQLLTIEATDFTMEEIDDTTQHILFQLQLQNITDAPIELQYVGYFPQLLEGYYSLPNYYAFDTMTIKPQQFINASYNASIDLSYKLTDEQQQFLQQNGHIMYFGFHINGDFYTTAVQLDI